MIKSIYHSSRGPSSIPSTPSGSPQPVNSALADLMSSFHLCGHFLLLCVCANTHRILTLHLKVGSQEDQEFKASQGYRGHPDIYETLYQKNIISHNK